MALTLEQLVGDVVYPALEDARAKVWECQEEIERDPLRGMEWHGEELLRAVHKVQFYEVLLEVIQGGGNPLDYFDAQAQFALEQLEGLSTSPMKRLSAACQRQAIAEGIRCTRKLFERTYAEQPYAVKLIDTSL